MPDPLSWNDSLAGDYLWTSGNLGEAVPDVMTPATWSLVQRFIRLVMVTSFTTPYPPIGNIGGRFYMNLSAVATMTTAMGVGPKRIRGVLEQAFGHLPPGVFPTGLPLARGRWLRALFPVLKQGLARQKAYRALAPAFIAAAPARCEALRATLRACPDGPALLALWRDEVEPYMVEACRVQEAGRTETAAALWLPALLKKLLGPEDASLLLTGGGLASLGPVLGLTQLARGELDRETFASRYGHRGPHEFEVSIPRPGEDSAWVDRQLEGLRKAPLDAPELLARQEALRQAAWERLVGRHVWARWLRGSLEKSRKAAATREDARSEVIRAFWALRAFYLRAAELTGADVFCLAIEELLAVLGGDGAPLAFVAARRADYERYAALPVYPTVIRGAFDPFAWAADPQRRQDVYDAQGNAPLGVTAITGFPGAAGIVEGVVRVALTVEEGHALQPGEVLVTVTTNVGWTPLFPRAAAVVTDVGAPLSHAAIVARELGIPAVVGCGNATMRLKSGDRVRVDGAAGTVVRLG
ncbi:MAG: phosphoenolpyruvate synthase [Cyanobacteria bacterium RYN_339]|nr:phosphoenolpyruvate synthase [Cyanobacteria bacterium RYN_339]